METWQATALTAVAIVLVIMWGKPLLDYVQSLMNRTPTVEDDNRETFDAVAEWTQAREALKRLGILEDSEDTLTQWRDKIACGLMCLGNDES